MSLYHHHHHHHHSQKLSFPSLPVSKFVTFPSRTCSLPFLSFRILSVFVQTKNWTVFQEIVKKHCGYVLQAYGHQLGYSQTSVCNPSDTANLATQKQFTFCPHLSIVP